MDNQKSRFFRKPFQSIGLVLFLFGLLSLLYIPIPSHTFLWKALNNFAHVPLFGLVALIVLSLSRLVFVTWNRMSIRHYLFAMIGALALALVTEMLQAYSSTRQSELSDILLDFVGATCGLVLYFTYDQQGSGRWAHWQQAPQNVILRFCVVVLFGVSLQPVLGWAYAYWDRASRFPFILQFSSDWEMKFVKVSNSELKVLRPPEKWLKSPEDMVGEVTFQTKRYPGIHIDEPYPDWRGFSSLHLDVFSSLTHSQPIVLRIDDYDHNNEHSDRFNKNINISPGFNHIKIPIDEIRLAPVSREMDMSVIKKIVLFAANPPENFSLYLDNLRLE